MGTLHASVFRDRLEKEYGASIIITAPTVPFKVVWKDGTETVVLTLTISQELPRFLKSRVYKSLMLKR